MPTLLGGASVSALCATCVSCRIHPLLQKEGRRDSPAHTQVLRSCQGSLCGAAALQARAVAEVGWDTGPGVGAAAAKDPISMFFG